MRIVSSLIQLDMQCITIIFFDAYRFLQWYIEPIDLYIVVIAALLIMSSNSNNNSSNSYLTYNECTGSLSFICIT